MLAVKQRIGQEYDAFTQTLNEWSKLKEQEIELKKAEFSQRLHEVDERMKHQFLQVEQKMKAHAQQMEVLMHNLQQAVRPVRAT